jgi:hypothetical protein
MSPLARRLSGRQLGNLALLAVTLAVAGRTVQLACAPGEKRAVHPVATSARLTANAQPAPSASATLELDAELGRLYMACPASAVIDLKEVVECAARETPVTSADDVPRVAYPVPVRVATRTDVVRESETASVPRIRYPVPVSRSSQAVGRVATRLQNGATRWDGVRVAQNSEGWLVDPNAWYSPEDLQKLNGGSAAASVPDADVVAEEPVVEQQPSAIELQQSPVQQPPVQQPPLQQPSVQQPSVQQRVETPSPPVEPSPSVPLESFSPAEKNTEVTPVRPLPSSMFSPPAPPSVPPSVQQFSPPAGTGAPPAAPASSGLAASAAAKKNEKDEDPHRELIARNRYPSARECATCHQKIYDEWSSSSHAYATVSPMFQKFEQKINDLAQGTIGYFCYRCHAPVATSMCESRVEPIWNFAEVAREGVTCIACHRVQTRYAKVNGERRIEEGPIFAPVFGGIGGDGVAEVVHRKDHFKVKTGPDETGPGQDIHTSGIYFDQLGKSEFCVSCHQVAVHPGIKLEVVWEQYRASPACKKGIRCQDCHMGKIPGVPSGFEFGPAAEVAGKKVNENRRHSNHVFYGPGYSIAHPGIFPMHLKSNRWTMPEWLLFDWRAGWGTDDFEDAVADKKLYVNFPPVWKESDDRYDAREIIDENFKKLAAKKELRRQVMENGAHVDGPFFDNPPCRGNDLRFNYIVTNTNEGHNLPSGSLGAQPQLWANVVLIGPSGQRLWESGYTDSYGDVADIHSEDVRNKRVPFDWQLFNLQTMFLITGAKGTDREMFLPVNVDFDQLPFIRPGNIPISVTNHPPFIRMEGRSLAPLGSRKVPYRVPAELMQQPGTYRLSFRMRSRAEPIYFMRFVGATVEMQRAMNEWMVDVHPYSVEFVVP